MLRRSQQGEILHCIGELGRIERENRREAKQRQVREEEMENIPHPNPPQQAVAGEADLRPIGAFDAPNTREAETGVPTPTIAANNYEIKSSLINMVQNQKFNGLALEDPLDHLDQFERLCRTVKMNGVPQESIKMILFPFSLGNKASQWEKNIASEQVSTWDLCKKEFLNKFFPKQKTAKLRNDITSFKQGCQESLYEAWDRLKGYTRSCPHHGISKENLLGIFYRGTLEKYRRALDTASNGSFDNLNVNQGEQLIENLAQSDACYGSDYDRDTRDYSVHDQRYKELNEKLDKMSKAFLVSQKPVNYVGEFEGIQQGYQDMGIYAEGNDEVHEEVNYVANQGGFQGRNFNQNYRNHPNLLYRSNNVENPQDQVYPPPQAQAQGYQPKQYVNQQQMPQAPLPQGNQSGYQPNPVFAPGFKQPYQARNNNYQGQQGGSNNASQDLDMKNMLQQILAGQVKGQQETTRQIAEIHSKIDGGYNDLQTKIDNLQSHVKNLDNQVAQVASSSKRPMGSLPGKPEPNPKEYINAITLRSGTQLPSGDNEKETAEFPEEDELMLNPEESGVIVEEQVEEVIEKTAVNKQKEKVTDETSPDEPAPKPSQDRTPSKKESLYVPPPYEPKLPFPCRFKKQLVEKYRELFDKQMSEVTITMPILDAFVLSPPTTSS